MGWLSGKADCWETRTARVPTDASLDATLNPLMALLLGHLLSHSTLPKTVDPFNVSKFKPHLEETWRRPSFVECHPKDMGVIYLSVSLLDFA